MKFKAAFLWSAIGILLLVPCSVFGQLSEKEKQQQEQEKKQELERKTYGLIDEIAGGALVSNYPRTVRICWPQRPSYFGTTMNRAREISSGTRSTSSI